MSQNLTFDCGSEYFTTVQCSVRLIVVYACIAVVGVVGNLNTCVVVASNRNMHTATNCYLFNIAVSDLVTLFCGAPVLNYLPINTDASCKLRLLMAIGSVYVTKLTVGALSVERYVAVCHPFLASRHQQSGMQRALKVVAATWLLGFSCALPVSLHFDLTRHADLPALSMCTITSKLGFFVGGVFSLSFAVVPMLVLFVMYVRMGLALRSSVKAIRSNNDAVDRSKQRAPILLTVVVLAFFVCWVPVTVSRLLVILSRLGIFTEVLERVAYVYMKDVSDILFYSSSLINPIIYNMMSKKFRRAFKNTLFKCCNARCFLDDSSLSTSNDTSSSQRKKIIMKSCESRYNVKNGNAELISE